MIKIRKLRQDYRILPKGYYHLCSDGWKEGRLFTCDRQYAAGVTAIALMTLKFNIEIYGYVLMPNHIHILLSGTGNDCVNAFELFLRKCTWWLKNDNCLPLPDGYGFRLIPVDSPESFRSHYLYLSRNPYEKGVCIPGAYDWGSDYVLFSQVSKRIRGIRAGDMSLNAIRRITGCRQRLPDDWIIHPELGILPSSFVQLDKIRELFPSPKAYTSRLVKDYESLLHISRDLEETLTLSSEEVKDIIFSQIRRLFPGKTLRELTIGEKYRLASLLNGKYRLTAEQLSRPLYLSEHKIIQALNAKESWD